MTRFQTTFLFAASALPLAACASPSGPEGGVVQVSANDGRGNEAVVVTASKREATTQDATALGVTATEAYAPPMPPPPPMAKMAPGQGYAGTYAQIAPQPMPGDVNRDRYQDVELNGVKLVAQEPVSTFSIDVDTASYSNVRRMLNAGHLATKDAARIEELIKYVGYG